MDKLAAMATFAAVVEAGSFTRAADVLALPKARVSQRVADLEHHLGVQLLQRTTRALNLTVDGQAYYGKCRHVLEEIDELEGALKGGTVEPRGRLRVEALASVARWLIAPHLHEFQARYPHISLRLGGSDRIGHMLEDGIDCAIRGGTLEDSTLIARHVCGIKLGLYASPAYLSDASAVRHPQDLAHHRRLSWFASQRLPFAWRLETADETIDLPEVDGLQFDDPDVAIASCMAGSGICPGAPFAVEAWVRAGTLVPVLPDWSFPVRSIHLIYPSKKHLSTRVRCFVDWLIDLIQDHQGVRMSPRDLAENLP